MKKITAVFLALILTMFSFTACSAEPVYFGIERTASTGVAAVTFNCAAPWGSLLKGTQSSARVKKFAAYMNAVKPDFIGTQEMNNDWLSELSEQMADYEFYGVARGGDKNEKQSELNAVFWLKDKYTLIDSGTFWLSETPEKESRYTGAGCNRVCTWVLLQNKETNAQYLHMNTHLDNMSEEAQGYGANVILAEEQKLTAQYPNAAVILTGDFNQTRGMRAHSAVSAVLNDSLTAAESGEIKGTYQEWGEQENTEPIDFIFSSSDLKAVNYEVLDDLSNGYVSDHYGVYTEFTSE